MEPRGRTGSTGEAATSPGRDHALDGLRGLAALIVVCFHCLMAATWIYTREHDSGLRAAFGWALRTLFFGRFEVYVFFVLSGYVLTRPFLRRRADGARWTGYAVSRVFRLYLPAWGALALSAALVAFYIRLHPAGANYWLRLELGQPLHASDARDLLLGSRHRLNDAYWSLEYEVMFSVLLPLFVLWARFRCRRPGMWLVKFVVAFAVIAWGFRSGYPVAQYLPMFSTGAVLAADGDLATAAVRRLLKPSPWPLLGLIVAALMSALWLQAQFLSHLRYHQSRTALSYLALAVAATLVVLASLGSAGLRRFLQRQAVQWLGTRSFSLYLVHGPVVFAIVTMTLPTLHALAIVPSLAASLVLAEAFYRLVEHPAHRFARAAGTVAADAWRRRSGSDDEPVPLPA